MEITDREYIMAAISSRIIGLKIMARSSVDDEALHDAETRIDELQKLRTVLEQVVAEAQDPKGNK